MPLGKKILLTLRSTQVLRLFLVGSYFPILSVLYSVVCIIVSPSVIYFVAIALCVFRFTDCDYPFGIFKLNKTSDRSRKHEHILETNGRPLCSIPRKFFFPIDKSVSEEISFLCLTDKKL